VARTRKQAKTAKESEVGSEEWRAREQQKARLAAATMKDLATSAAQGSQWAVKSLREWAAKHPDVARSLSQLGDLCENAEAEWVRALAGDSPTDQLAIRDQIGAMKAELLPGKASILERVMVSNVVTAYLAHQRAVIWAARPAQHEAVATARQRRVESTARWFQVAIKTLAVVRQQASRGLAPKTKLKLFEASG
jgi:hypothetical protein